MSLSNCIEDMEFRVEHVWNSENDARAAKDMLLCLVPIRFAQKQKKNWVKHFVFL